jgi:hypothetical protein
MDQNDLVYRLRKRAEIRRQIPTRKSVQENQPDRIADLLEEAANEIERLKTAPVFPQWPNTASHKRGCHVCGIGANGEVMGYVCSRSDCPTRISY